MQIFEEKMFIYKIKLTIFSLIQYFSLDKKEIFIIDCCICVQRRIENTVLTGFEHENSVKDS